VALLLSPQVRSRLITFGTKRRLQDEKRRSVNIELQNEHEDQEHDEPKGKVIEKVDGMQVNTSAGEFSVRW
jgi:hypothetical protein